MEIIITIGAALATIFCNRKQRVFIMDISNMTYEAGR